jgi:hypothetical protein
MVSISDNDLILFHYSDGLLPEQLREIERSLAESPVLRARLQRLQELLSQADRDPVPQPDPQFERRIWSGLQARIGGAAEAVTASPLSPAAVIELPRRARRWPAALAAGMSLAAAAAVLIAIKTPFTTDSVTRPASVPAITAKRTMRDQVLVAELATHLRNTKSVLLTVANSDSSMLMPPDEAFVRSLVQDNRLYVAAAKKRGAIAVAGFLQTLDPVLIEVAHQTRVGAIQYEQGLRDFVRDSDILFQVRTVEARLASRPDIRA